MPRIKRKSSEKIKKRNKIFLNLKVGESGEHIPVIHQGKTSPPKPYTEATLLRAMETAGKQVEDEELRELMKTMVLGDLQPVPTLSKRFSKENILTKRKRTYTQLQRYRTY